MNRKSFFKHLSLLGASFGIFARAAEAAKAKIGIAPKEKFESEKKIFKLGKHTLKIKIPEYLKPKLNDLAFNIFRDHMDLERHKSLTPKIDGDFFVFDVEFAKEGMYQINVFDNSQKNKKKKGRPIAKLNIYALEDDLYALRPMKGDTHIHSTNSDGRNPPIEVAMRCYEVGLDFQAISDHRCWKTSDDMMKQLGKYDTSMSFYHAEECHFAITHVHNLGGSQGITQYINANKAMFDKRVAELAKTLPKDMSTNLKVEIAKTEVQFQIIREFGGLAVLNHPYWLTGRGNFNMTGSSIDAICARKNFDAYEFVNYGCKDISTSLSNAKYTELREQGIKYPVLGTTDAHNVNNQGMAYTILFAKSNKWADVKDAILDRRSLAVCDTLYVESRPKDRERMIYGERRYINYAHFLVKEYFPAHGELVIEEGKVLQEILDKGESDERLAKLKSASAKTKAHWDSIKA